MNTLTKLPTIEQAWARRKRHQRIAQGILAVASIAALFAPIVVLHIVW